MESFFSRVASQHGSKIEFCSSSSSASLDLRYTKQQNFVRSSALTFRLLFKLHCSYKGLLLAWLLCRRHLYKPHLS